MLRKRLCLVTNFILFFIFFLVQIDNYCKATTIDPVGAKLSAALNLTTKTTDLSTFTTNVINYTLFNNAAYINYPSTTNSIFTKTQFFYDARATELLPYQTTLLSMLSDAKIKYFLNSTQAPMVAMWGSTVNNELQLYNNFLKLLSISNTPKFMLTNIAQQISYNKTYYQGTPIFSTINNFYTTRMQNLATNINYLQELMDLLNACSDKNFLTTDEKTAIFSMIPTLSTDIATLTKTLSDFQTVLSKNTTDPAGLYTNLLGNLGFKLPIFQDYPSATNSVYTTLKNFFTNRETYFITNKNFFIDLEKATSRALTLSTTFLTATEVIDVKSWDATLTQEIALISKFNTIFTSATSVANLTIICKDSVFNRTIFQDYPSTTNSIYTKIKGVYTTRTQTSTSLTPLVDLLTSAQGKTFLSITQNTDVGTWLTKAASELSTLSDPTIVVKSSFTTDVNAASTMDQVLNVVNNAVYNQTYLQNFEATTALFTKIQNLYNSAITTPNATLLANINNLLTATQNKNFLTDAQKNNVNSWQNTVTSEINVFVGSPPTTVAPAAAQPAPQRTITQPTATVPAAKISVTNSVAKPTIVPSRLRVLPAPHKLPISSYKQPSKRGDSQKTTDVLIR